VVVLFFVLCEEGQQMLLFVDQVVHRVDSVLVGHLDVREQVREVLVEKYDGASGEDEEVVGGQPVDSLHRTQLDFHLDRLGRVRLADPVLDHMAVLIAKDRSVDSFLFVQMYIFH
jgi:hypothetical protein